MEDQFSSGDEEISQLSQPTQLTQDDISGGKKQTNWTKDMEVALLRQVIRAQPFAAKHGQLMERWEYVANTLIGFGFCTSTTGRGCQNRTNKLVKSFEKKNIAQQGKGSSGGTQNVTEMDQLCQDLMDRMKEVEEEKLEKVFNKKKKAIALMNIGESLMTEAEERVAKRLKVEKTPNDTPVKKENDCLTELLQLEREKIAKESDIQAKRIAFEREQLAYMQAQQQIQQRMLQSFMDNQSAMLQAVLSKLDSK